MSGIALDASAMLALLRGEPGADRVGDIIADSAISTVNLCEVIGTLARDGFSELEIQALLDGLPAEHVPFDDVMAFAAGLLVPLTRPAGLSLGDRACLALALRMGGAALTCDRAWSQIADAVGVEIELIR